MILGKGHIRERSDDDQAGGNWAGEFQMKFKISYLRLGEGQGKVRLSSGRFQIRFKMF